MSHSSVFILNKQASVASSFLSDLRNVNRQNDRRQFRRNVERIGEVLAYELSKTLPYTQHTVQTPLDTLTVDRLAVQPVLVPVLRAGLPLYQGVLNYFDEAPSGFIGAFRQPTTADEFTIEADYHALPSVVDQPVILIDPMLATGQTLIQAMHLLAQYGPPSHVHVVAAISCPEGIDYIQAEAPLDCSLWLGAVDSHLNQKSYIVPGLGDAGDLAFGPKL